MKQIRTLKLLLIIALWGVSLASAVLPTTSVSALNDAEIQSCINTYNGETLSTTGAISQFADSDCNVSNGGPCIVADVTIRNEPILGCNRNNISGGDDDTNLNRQQCIDKFHGKIPGAKMLNRLENNGCLEKDGGPCKVTLLAEFAVGGDIVDCKSEYTRAHQYCKKYDNDAKRNACKKGYEDGKSACSDVGRNEKAACEDGADEAKSRRDFIDDGESPVGTEYDADDCKDGLEGDCKLVDLVVMITNVLSGLAALVIVAMIVWGGIQYSMAGADPSKVQAARQKIMNAVIALLLLVFGFSVIQWLVPGGLI